MFKISRSTLGLGAIVLTAPLVLAACGSDEEGTADNAAATSTTRATATTARPTSTEAEAPTTAAAAEGEQAEEQEPAAEAQGNGQLANPLAGGIQPADLKPVEGGQAAGEADAASIDALVKGYNNQATVRQVTEYTYDHLCQRLVDANGGRDAFLAGMGTQDLALADIPGYDAEANRITSVSDIQVSGTEASATATNAIDSRIMRFSNENGEWKFCG